MEGTRPSYLPGPPRPTPPRMGTGAGPASLDAARATTLGESTGVAHQQAVLGRGVELSRNTSGLTNSGSVARTTPPGTGW